jgi:hypothetical protein
MNTSTYGTQPEGTNVTQSFGALTVQDITDVGHMRFGPGRIPSMTIVNGRVTEIEPSRDGDAVFLGYVSPATGIRPARGPLLSVGLYSRLERSAV